MGRVDDRIFRSAGEEPLEAVLFAGAFDAVFDEVRGRNIWTKNGLLIVGRLPAANGHAPEMLCWGRGDFLEWLKSYGPVDRARIRKWDPIASQVKDQDLRNSLVPSATGLEIRSQS